MARSRIAVLYFDAYGSGRDVTSIADGFTEDLIQALQSARGLNVISKAGAATIRGLDIPLDSVARTLRVGALVTGIISLESDSIRVAVRMLDDAGIEMDRVTFKKSAKDLVSLSEDLVSQVAALVRRRVSESVRFAQMRAGTRNGEAWLRYQRAVQTRGRGDSLFNARAIDAGQAAYETADSIAAIVEAFDPRWAEPSVLRGGIAYARARRAISDSAELRRLLDVANEHVARAFALKPNNAHAHALRGDLRYLRWLLNVDRDTSRHRRLLAAAQNDLETAVRLNPALAATHASLSHMYNNVPGKTLADVRIAATKALETDAFLVNSDVIIGRIALAAYDEGRFTEADKWCREGRRRFPRNARFARCQLYVLAMPGAAPTVDAAWALADSLEQETVGVGERRSVHEFAPVLVAAALARAGLKDSARAVLTRVNGSLVTPGTGSFDMFAAYAWVLVGDHRAAVSHLRAHYAKNPQLRGQKPNQWWFTALDEDPQFQLLVGLPSKSLP